MRSILFLMDSVYAISPVNNRNATDKSNLRVTSKKDIHDFDVLGRVL